MKYVIPALIFVFSSAAFAGPQEPVGKIPENGQIALNYAAIDLYIRKFNSQVKNGSDFAAMTSPYVPVAQKKELAQYFSKLGTAPQLRREEDHLIFEFGKELVAVRWPKFGGHQVFIDGTPWVFDPSAPIRYQIEAFGLKFKAKPSENALMQWLLPTANAGVANILGKVGSKTIHACGAVEKCKWVATGVGGAMVMNLGADVFAGLKTGGYNVGCLLISPLKPWYSGWCFEWKKNWDKVDEYEKAREAVKKDPDVEYIPSKDAQCPKDEKGEEIYDAWFGETTKNAKGEWTPKNRWYHFYGKGRDSNFTEAYILSRGQNDAKEPNLAEAQLIYSKADKPILQKLRLKTKKESSDGKDDFIMINLIDEENLIPIEYREENRRLKMVAAAAEAWYKTCRLLSRGSKIAPDRVEEGVKKMQEQPDAPTTGSVPTTK